MKNKKQILGLTLSGLSAILLKILIENVYAFDFEGTIWSPIFSVLVLVPWIIALNILRRTLSESKRIVKIFLGVLISLYVYALIDNSVSFLLSSVF